MPAGPWAEATRIAKDLVLGYVGTDMLLLGLARSGGLAAQVLGELGATDEALTTIVSRINAGEEPADPSIEPRPTPAAEHARGRAEGLAIALGIPDDSVSLLLALAYDRMGFHSSVLANLGADRRQIVESLAARGIPVPATPPAPDAPRHTDNVILPDEHARIVAAELARLSVEDKDRYFDPWGAATWGYGSVRDRPDDAQISAEPRIDLRATVTRILRDKGLPQPPEDAWSSD